MVAGQGDDLVVLEAGLGASGLSWGPVHDRIAQHARVVAYERAGYGASTPAAADTRHLEGLAEDLHAVVRANPHQRLVFVGHSWGGPIVRRLAAKLAAEKQPLVGLVLVDQSDEHMADLFTSRAARFSSAVQDAMMPLLARTRLLGSIMKTQLVGLPPATLEAALAAATSPAAARATVNENRWIGGEMQRLEGNSPVLGDIGISVISGQQHGRFDAWIRRRMNAAHRSTAADHPQARYIAATESGHMVPMTEPGLIAAEALSFFSER